MTASHGLSYQLVLTGSSRNLERLEVEVGKYNLRGIKVSVYVWLQEMQVSIAEKKTWFNSRKNSKRNCSYSTTNLKKHFRDVLWEGLDNIKEACQQIRLKARKHNATLCSIRQTTSCKATCDHLYVIRLNYCTSAQ